MFEYNLTSSAANGEHPIVVVVEVKSSLIYFVIGEKRYFASDSHPLGQGWGEWVVIVLGVQAGWKMERVDSYCLIRVNQFH
jgi:hypothetical protein